MTLEQTLDRASRAAVAAGGRRLATGSLPDGAWVRYRFGHRPLHWDAQIAVTPQAECDSHPEVPSGNWDVHVGTVSGDDFAFWSPSILTPRRGFYEKLREEFAQDPYVSVWKDGYGLGGEIDARPVL